jgi:3-hydroxyisobutyrate dehydrogenase
LGQHIISREATLHDVAEAVLPRVGWVGTGVMGAAMCAHLVAAGYPVRVFTRSKERARPLLEQGAEWSASPAEAADGADFAFSMVGYPSDVREVVLGPRGVLSTAKRGSTVIDMTTSEPQLAREIFEAAAAKGVGSLDAPVSGGDVGARNLQGGPGAGQHTKMANQIAISSGMVAVCEALLYAFRAGLDVEKVIETIGTGAAGSWSLSNYGPRALRGDFEPGFRVDHFIKDLGIALSEARRLGLALPGLALAEQLYLATRAQGLGQKGTHSLLLALAQLSGLNWGDSH